jgi:6-phosphofructokinase 1
VNPEDAVAERIVVQKGSPRGVHFRRAGPREKVYFKSEEVRACIVTCGGLCPGINTVIREIVCGLNYMYGVEDILGIEGGYRGFYSKNTMRLTPKVVNDIHKRGGTFLRTSRGGHDTQKIVDNIQDRGINQVDHAIFCLTFCDFLYYRGLNNPCYSHTISYSIVHKENNMY